MLRWIAVVSLALAAAGCATVSYLTENYGTANKDGEVTLPNGTTYWIFENKTKPKMLVSTDAAQAAQMGMVAGLTFGGVSGAIPPPIFEQAAQQWLAQTGRAHCRLVGGYPIDRMYYEFNVACDPTSVARR
jgi:hypothetical protein